MKANSIFESVHTQSGRDRIGSSSSSNGNAGRVSGELVPMEDGAGGAPPAGGNGDGGGGGGGNG